MTPDEDVLLTKFMAATETAFQVEDKNGVMAISWVGVTGDPLDFCEQAYAQAADLVRKLNEALGR